MDGGARKKSTSSRKKSGVKRTAVKRTAVKRTAVKRKVRRGGDDCDGGARRRVKKVGAKKVASKKVGAKKVHRKKGGKDEKTLEQLQKTAKRLGIARSKDGKKYSKRALAAKIARA